MNLIQELSEQHPIAWKAFIEWALVECYEEWGERTNDYLGTLERYLLADLQAWLDSVGMKVDNGLNIAGEFRSGIYMENERRGWHPVAGNGYWATRPEALKAAIEQGLKIYQTNNK